MPERARSQQGGQGGMKLPALLGRLRARIRPASADHVYVVGGRCDLEGWKVQLRRDGALLASLDPAAARLLAAELVQMADVIEGAL